MSTRFLAVSVPGEPCYLKAVRNFFNTALGDLFGDQADMVVLALDESCSNILKYSQEGKVLNVSAELQPEKIVFRIENFCDGEDIPKIKPRELKSVRPGGLGTHFIQRIMDRVDFEPQPDCPGRYSLVLEKSLPGK